MKSFKTFLRTLNKKYVCLQFDHDSNQKLRKYAEANGFDLSKDYNGNDQSPFDFDFHITVFYTTSEHDTQEGEYKIKPFQVVFDKFDLFGENKDVPVLKVKLTDDLVGVRKRFEMMGFKDKWEEYKPHMTLSYSASAGKPPLPDFPVTATKIIIEKQK